MSLQNGKKIDFIFALLTNQFRINSIYLFLLEFKLIEVRVVSYLKLSRLLHIYIQ